MMGAGLFVGALAGARVTTGEGVTTADGIGASTDATVVALGDWPAAGEGDGEGDAVAAGDDANAPKASMASSARTSRPTPATRSTLRGGRSPVRAVDAATAPTMIGAAARSAAPPANPPTNAVALSLPPASTAAATRAPALSWIG